MGFLQKCFSDVTFDFYTSKLENKEKLLRYPCSEFFVKLEESLKYDQDDTV